VTSEEVDAVGLTQLGLSSSVPLPQRYPNAWSGKDIVVFESRKDGKRAGAINLYGRNCSVASNIKKALKDKWPNHFQ